MFNRIRSASSTLKPFYRLFKYTYHIVAIVSIIFSLASLLYGGFFDHRNWLNERIALSYEGVEEQQGVVLNALLAKIPSESNNYRPPSPDDLDAIRSTLTKLSVAISKVDTPNGSLSEASQNYRGSISNLSRALIQLNKDVPETNANLLLAVDKLDLAAQSYATAVEERISSYRRSLAPSS